MTEEQNNPTPSSNVMVSDPKKLAADYMVASGLSQEKADAIALLLSRTIGFATPTPAPRAG